MVEGVAAVTGTPSSYTYKKVVSHVYDTEVKGQSKIVQDVYLTTVYDANGKVSAVTTAHTIDFLV